MGCVGAAFPRVTIARSHSPEGPEDRAGATAHGPETIFPSIPKEQPLAITTLPKLADSVGNRIPNRPSKNRRSPTWHSWHGPCSKCLRRTGNRGPATERSARKSDL